MTTVLDIQRALLARGFDIGKSGADGLPGPATYAAIMKSLGNDPIIAKNEPLPADWLPGRGCNTLRSTAVTMCCFRNS